MYDAYKRITSYFENSPLAATGLPSEAEKALLEPFRDKLPGAVFGDAVTPPVSDGSGQDRALLKQRRGTVRGGRLHAQGQCASAA